MLKTSENYYVSLKLAHYVRAQSSLTVKKIYEIPGFFLTKPSWDREKSVLRRDYFRIFGPIQRKDFLCFEDVKSVPLMEG
jgi:hypothetical protein